MIARSTRRSLDDEAGGEISFCCALSKRIREACNQHQNQPRGGLAQARSSRSAPSGPVDWGYSGSSSGPARSRLAHALLTPQTSAGRQESVHAVDAIRTRGTFNVRFESGCARRMQASRLGRASSFTGAVKWDVLKTLKRGKIVP